MAIADVLRTFRDLKREGVVQDYILFGSVAAMVHTRPFFTRDLDIGVAVESDEEFLDLFRRLAALGEVSGHAVILHGTPVEIFPVNISPIIQDAMLHPVRKRVEDVVVNVASVEHLLLEALRVHRTADKARVLMLNEVVDKARLRKKLRRLDRDGKLKRRYQALARETP